MNWVFIIVGLIFVTIGIIVPNFRLYWLIAGLNGRAKKELENYSLRYIEKYFGIFMLVLGVLTVLNPIVWSLLNKEEYIGRTFMITTLSVVASMFLFGAINRRKIYKS
jgi:hypothetical protein